MAMTLIVGWMWSRVSEVQYCIEKLVKSVSPKWNADMTMVPVVDAKLRDKTLCQLLTNDVSQVVMV